MCFMRLMARAKTCKSNAKYHMLVSNTPHIKVGLKIWNNSYSKANTKSIFYAFVHNFTSSIRWFLRDLLQKNIQIV